MSELSQLRWRCRRGMRELDAVLQAFLAKSYESLSDSDKQRFAAILDLPDPELYGYIVRRNEPTDAQTTRLIALIRESIHSQA
jgi:antitoxin CptB